MSIQGSSSGMAQSMSSVSAMQQLQLAQATQNTAPVAPSEPVRKPVGSLGHNIDVSA